MNPNIQNNLRRGFLVLEAIIALALFSICVFSIVALSLGSRRMFEEAQDRLVLIDSAAPVAADPAAFGQDFTYSAYGNDATIAAFSSSTAHGAGSSFGTTSLSFVALQPDTFSAYGKDTCPPILDLSGRASTTATAALPIPPADMITDLSVKDGFAYITANSNKAADPDLFIFDASDAANPRLVSSLDTGPGLAALSVAGTYIFAANESSVSQLQVIDIHDRAHPALVAQAKVPLDISSSTPPDASAVFYDKGFVYLGTEKGDSPELTVWSVVADPVHPMLSGRYETGNMVEKILADGDRLYVAGTDGNQLMDFDVTDPTSPVLLSVAAPPGFQTQTGQALDLFQGALALGRDTGGFDNKANPEFILYGVSDQAGQVQPDQQSSFDEPGGVYGLVARPPGFIVLTHRSTGQLRLDSASGTTSASYSIPGVPAAMSCDWGDVYVASNNGHSITLIKDFHE